MISSQTSALFLLLCFYHQSGIQTDKGTLLGKLVVGGALPGEIWPQPEPEWVLLRPSCHLEAEVDEPVLERS